MSGDCPRIVAPSTSCDCVRPCSSKWPEKNFGMDLKQLSREELEIAFYNIHTKNECLSKALKDNVKQIKRLNKIVKKNEEDRRRCLSPTKQLYEDRISQLEQANTFLQDKVLVLRHQLQSHSRLHAKAHRNSSHISRSIHSTKTSQTHLSQLPIPNSENINRDEKQDSKEDLNVDLVENDDRISQLQNELDQNPSDAAKVAENIELIRLRRLVKRQASQLSTLNAHLEVADKELDQLRSNYNEASLENDSVLRQLMTEKQRLREVQNELIELGNLKQDIKILQEQVRDLQSERSLLRSNNDKLLEIASGKSEEDTSQQPKNDADKEIEKDAKEETEKIYSKTQKSAGRSCSHYKINTILEDANKYSVSKRVSGIFVKHNWFKELFAKVGSANTYDLDIEPCTEVSLFKAFSHQELSDLFSKEFICPSTLNYTIMPLIQVTDNSIEGEEEDDDDDKKNEKVEEMSEKEISESEKKMSGENDSASKNFDDGDDRNVVDDRNSELSLNEAKFVFMQILKHELENYDSASNQLLHDRSSENEETNTSYENNQAENTTTFRQPSNLVDYFWGIVGYKIFFPKKSQKIVEISKHPENVISNNVPGTSNSFNPPPYHTISISDQSFETSNSIEGCILQIENVDNNQCKRDCSATNQEPKFDIGSEESQAIEITSYHTINSDRPQTSEEFILGDFETKSKAQGDASTTNSAGMSSSTLQKSSSEEENVMFKEIHGNIDAAPHLPRTVAHDENKDSAAEKGSKDSKHSQTPTDQFQVVNDSNKCSCKSSQGVGQYILEEHKPDSSRNVNDSKTNNIQNLPDQEKTTFTVYNLNRETGSRDKIGILFLKKISCECNLKSITGIQTQEPSASNYSETDHVGDKKEAHPEKSGNFQPKDEHKPYGDNEQKQLNNDENEMNHPLSVDSGAPLSENQKLEGFESAPLLTLLRRLLQKFLGEPENVTSGPRFSVDDVVIESPHVNNSASAAQSSNDNALTRNSEHDNANDIVQNNKNNIVKISKDGLAPLSATKSFERNCESSTSKRNKSFQRSSDPGLSRFNTKPIETQTYNRRSTNKDEKIGEDYHASSGQTLKTMAGTDDSSRQNSNPLLINSPRSSSRSPDRKISQTLNEDNGIPLSTDPPRSVNRSPDRKTPQTLNDKNHGKPSEVVKTTPTVRDKLPIKMIRENSQNTKSTETQTYNRRSTDENDKIGQDYHVSRGQTLKTMAETDSFRQNSNPLPRSRSRSPDIKISQTLNKDNSKTLSTDTPRSVNRSPDRKTPQTSNDKNHGKPSEVVKTTLTVRDRLPKNMSRENSVKSFELKKQVTPHDCLSTNPPRSVNRSPDRRTPQTLNDKNHGKPSEVPKTTPTVRDRSKTPRSEEGQRFLPYVEKIFQPPLNQPHKCVESSEGNDEVCERNLKLRSATSKPICSHERELITNVKKLLELLNRNFDSNENYSADESNDESDSLCSDRRMAFCTAEDDGRRIDRNRINSDRIISSGHNDCSSTQLSSEQSLPQECPTCLNKKLRLQQMNVSNDSPFSKNPKIDKRLINHEVDRSDHDTHRKRSRHPEMIIVVGKKLTIYESDKTEEK